ncbi:MAG: GNAT family N-acetyltransferase [Candidatus Moranbacteria bacterium]|nr:GNAT family N-acetyltransferase [Candidatus Moranbacteria bacterium]
MYKKLTGQRINLRKAALADAKSIYQNAKDKDICMAVPLPMPYTLKTAQEYIKASQKKWETKKEAQFGIEYGKTGEIIGMIGLRSLNFELKKAEVGYWLGKDYWGKGIAKEALGLILKFAFFNLKLNRVYAEVKSKNLSSSKLLERSNFKLEGRLRKDEKFKGKWDDLLIFGMLKHEFSSE